MSAIIFNNGTNFHGNYSQCYAIATDLQTNQTICMHQPFVFWTYEGFFSGNQYSALDSGFGFFVGLALFVTFNCFNFLSLVLVIARFEESNLSSLIFFFFLWFLWFRLIIFLFSHFSLLFAILPGEKNNLLDQGRLLLLSYLIFWSFSSRLIFIFGVSRIIGWITLPPPPPPPPNSYFWFYYSHRRTALLSVLFIFTRRTFCWTNL